MSEQGLIRLTGLWKGETKQGQVMLSGTVSPSSKLVILPNKDKQGNGPDYICYMAPNQGKKKKQEQGGGEL